MFNWFKIKWNAKKCREIKRSLEFLGRENWIIDHRTATWHYTDEGYRIEAQKKMIETYKEAAMYE